MDASKSIALETLENTPLTRKELFFVIDLFAKLDPLPKSEWLTPIFVKIQEKRTKRISPYLESELWDRDELLSVMPYEKYKRNKAALTLLWDLNCRNHEVTLLQIKHIQLKER